MNRLEKIRFGFHYARNHISQEIDLRTGFTPSWPHLLCILLTWGCNIKCQHCLMPFGRGEALKTDEWKLILRRLRKWLGATSRITFLGGEPLIRKDLFEIMRYCKELGLNAALTTNATLISEDRAKELGKLNLFNVGVSIDGITEEVQDYIRGAGTWRKIMEGLTYLKRYLPKTTKLVMKTIIMEPNIKDLVNMVRWTKEEGYTGIVFQPLDYGYIQYPLNPIIPGFYVEPEVFNKWVENYKTLWFRDIDEACGEIDNLIEMKKQGYPILNSVTNFEKIKRYIKSPSVREAGICKAGVGVAIVTPNGDLYNCCSFQEFPPIGNLLKDEPSKLWNSRKGRTKRHAIEHCKKVCLFFSHDDRSVMELLKLFWKYA